MAFEIVYSPEAIDHLLALTKFEQTIVVDQVDEQLVHEPQLPTRKRKLLRPNSIAPWELRIRELRVFYRVEVTATELVTIVAIGKKTGNQLWIGGERIDL